MFLSCLKLITLALVALPCLSFAAAPPDTSVALHKHPFECNYTISHDSAWRDRVYPISPYHARSVGECRSLCDRDARCASAQFEEPKSAKDTNCHLATTYGFAKQRTKPKASTTIIQMLPNSCNKAAATPTPFDCTPKTAQGSDNCTYKLKCGVGFKGEQPGLLLQSLDKTLEGCFKNVEHNVGGVGLSFSQGGECLVPINYDYVSLKTEPRPNSLVVQIVEGSCKKKAANPKR